MPEIPALEGRLGEEPVQLRAASEWDIPEILIAHQDDRDLHRRLGAEKPPTGAQLGHRMELAEADRRAGRRASYAIVEPDSDYCRGRIDVDAIDWQHGIARLQIWISPHFRSRGYARAALRLIAVWLLDRVGLSQLQMDIPLDNAPMLKAAAAAAFRPTDEIDVEHEHGDHVVLVRRREVLD